MTVEATRPYERFSEIAIVGFIAQHPGKNGLDALSDVVGYNFDMVGSGVRHVNHGNSYRDCLRSKL